MKVILLKDIQNIGKKHDIKQVKDGYARNFLFPKRLAKSATKEAIMMLEKTKKNSAIEAEQELLKTQKTASQIDGQGIEFLVKTGEENQLFEAITAQKIIKKLKQLGIDIKKDQIELERPIKELGEFPVKINLDHHLEAKIFIIVEPKEK